ncbi:MAG: DNA translocase FtsK, partial [Verrucomicrobiota bacterium]
TQSPRVDVVTGLIKANIPARIAFQVASNADSRVILDKSGAEKLVGKGDMLFQPPDSPILSRAQGAFLADEEVQDVVEFCSEQAQPEFDPRIEATLTGNGGAEDEGGETLSPADEETLQRCIEAIAQDRKASASYLQRRLRIGYVRAARMMDLLEERGYVGPGEGAKPREIYISQESVGTE